MSGKTTAVPTRADKAARVKTPLPGKPLFGCVPEHLQRLFCFPSSNTQDGSSNAASPAEGTPANGLQVCIFQYKNILRNIFDIVPLVPQSTKGPDGQQMTSLTSNYLCLQCSTGVSEDDLQKHGDNKSHRFYVESRNGTIYCHMCDDFIWDPTLEELRMRKIGTGSFYPRKRKHEEAVDEPAKDDARNIAANTNIPPCRPGGLRGIYNAGATCYQNVVLQSFLHNPLIRNFYLGGGHHTIDCMPHCLSCAMEDMYQDFYAPETTNGYAAANILSAFWISERKAFANLVTTKEQDAHEFFQFIAEELHECNGDGTPVQSATEAGCNCIVHQTFYGGLLTTTTCQNCGVVNSSPQSFLDLNLSLEGLAQRKSMKGGKASPTLTLHEVLDEEYVESDKCEYRCTTCNSPQQVRRQTSIQILPNVLCIQLKRFEFKNGSSKAASKIDTPVRFPLQLNMYPYTGHTRNRDGGDGFETARTCMYDLFSVVVHVGDIETGHYFSYCRTGGQWFMFNDHKVILAKKSDVLGAEAYLLFYITRNLA